MNIIIYKNNSSSNHFNGKIFDQNNENEIWIGQDRIDLGMIFDDENINKRKLLLTHIRIPLNLKDNEWSIDYDRIQFICYPNFHIDNKREIVPIEPDGRCFTFYDENEFIIYINNYFGEIKFNKQLLNNKINKIFQNWKRKTISINID